MKWGFKERYDGDILDYLGCWNFLYINFELKGIDKDDLWIIYLDEKV